MRIVALLLIGPLLAAPALSACACAEPERPTAPCHAPSDCCSSERPDDCPKALKFLDDADSYALTLDLAPAPATSFAEAPTPPRPVFEASEALDALPPGRRVPCPLLL